MLLASIYRGEARYRLAYDAIREAERLAVGHPDLLALTRNNLGAIQYCAGELEASHASYLRALESYASLGRERNEVQLRMNLGQVLLDSGRRGEAREWLESAIRLAESYGMRRLAQTARGALPSR